MQEKLHIFETYFKKKFCKITYSSIGVEHRIIKELNEIKFVLYDSSRWGGRFDDGVKKFIKEVDGIILMFDLSDKNDFNDLPRLLGLITEFHKLENFPVLLIGNKSDLDIEVNKYEIEKFLDKENLIEYF